MGVKYRWEIQLSLFYNPTPEVHTLFGCTLDKSTGILICDQCLQHAILGCFRFWSKTHTEYISIQMLMMQNPIWQTVLIRVIMQNRSPIAYSPVITVISVFVPAFYESRYPIDIYASTILSHVSSYDKDESSLICDFKWDIEWQGILCPLHIHL